MPVTIVATVLAGLLSLGIIAIGARYLLAPQASASTFGLPEWPAPSANGWLNVKGVRDIVSGLVLLPALVLAPPQVIGWMLLATAITPLVDAVIVLRNGGSKALGYGVHGGAAVAVVVAAVLFLVSG